MTQLILLLVTAACYFHYTYACSCFPSHPQVKFCNADFVIKARVQKEKLIWQNGHNFTTDPAHNFALYRYRVKVLHKFKGSALFPTKHAYIYTRGNGGLCGIRLPIDINNHAKNVWLLSGHVNNGKMFVGLCDWWTQCQNLTIHQRISLHFNRYQQGCSSCKDSNGNLKCKIPKRNISKSYCYYQYATCYPSGYLSTCRWKRGYRFWNCIKKT